MKIRPKHALDIGANIGQFPLTLASVVPSIKIDALEPNGDIYEILTKNAKAFRNIKTYNVGVGKLKKAKMFYEPSRSATGSLVAENVGAQKDIKEIPIKLSSRVSQLTKRVEYDLITIDVEGYEMDVVECLGDLKTKYLFMEVSGQGRTKSYSHSELLSKIGSTLGEFDIVYIMEHSAGNPTFDMLLEFRDNFKKRKAR